MTVTEERRRVLREYLEAGRHRLDGGRFKTYKRIATEIGVAGMGRTALADLIQAEYPKVAWEMKNAAIMRLVMSQAMSLPD